MKRMLLAGALSLFAATPAAFAADLPAGPPAQAPAAYVPVVAPVYNWSGIYIGINGGYGFGSTDWSPSGFTGPGTFNTNGGLVGGTAGFNFQSGSVVYGIEGDWDWAGIKGNFEQRHSRRSMAVQVLCLAALRHRAIGCRPSVVALATHSTAC